MQYNKFLSATSTNPLIAKGAGIPKKDTGNRPAGAEIPKKDAGIHTTDARILKNVTGTPSCDSGIQKKIVGNRFSNIRNHSEGIRTPCGNTVIPKKERRK